MEPTAPKPNVDCARAPEAHDILANVPRRGPRRPDYGPTGEYDRAIALATLDSADELDVRQALVDITLCDEDYDFVAPTILRFATSPVPGPRAVAVLCLGHIARLHRRLPDESVSIIRSALADPDPEVRDQAHSAESDVEIFMPWLGLIRPDLDPELRFWGSPLEQWPQAAVDTLPVPQADRDYLARVGLPLDVDWNLSVERVSRGQSPRVEHGLLVLARDGVTSIGADPDGRVWAITGDSKTLVNTSIRRFGRCLMTYEQHRMSMPDTDDDDAQDERLAIVLETAACLREADPEALASPDTYWARVVEELS